MHQGIALPPVRWQQTCMHVQPLSGPSSMKHDIDDTLCYRRQHLHAAVLGFPAIMLTRCLSNNACKKMITRPV